MGATIKESNLIDLDIHPIVCLQHLSVFILVVGKAVSELEFLTYAMSLFGQGFCLCPSVFSSLYASIE